MNDEIEISILRGEAIRFEFTAADELDEPIVNVGDPLFGCITQGDETVNINVRSSNTGVIIVSLHDTNDLNTGVWDIVIRSSNEVLLQGKLIIDGVAICR